MTSALFLDLYPELSALNGSHVRYVIIACYPSPSLAHLLLGCGDVLWVGEEVLGPVVDDGEARLRHDRHVPLARRDLRLAVDRAS